MRRLTFALALIFNQFNAEINTQNIIYEFKSKI
jgi:hypothetical protein